MVGIDGRSALLINLSQALESKREFFGPDGKSLDESEEFARPGNILGTQPEPKLIMELIWVVVI